MTIRQIKKPPQGRYLVSGGERGIRTLDTLQTYTHFPGVRLQPLSHLSGNLLQPIRLGARILAKISVSARILCFCQKHLGSKGTVAPLRGLKSITSPKTKNPTLFERRIILFGGVGGI